MSSSGHPDSAAPWVLATRSAGKLRELRALFSGQGIAVVDLDEAGIPADPSEDAVEAYETFAENALAKARWFAAKLPGRVVVADDSGLEVRALNGEPGVQSRRWSGRSDIAGAALDAANNALLLERMRGVADRRARFVCAAAWVQAGRAVVAEGTVEGRIETEPAGGHGFGYDPYFVAAELGQTLGQATVAEKERVSHRARAFGSLLARLREDVRQPVGGVGS